MLPFRNAMPDKLISRLSPLHAQECYIIHMVHKQKLMSNLGFGKSISTQLLILF